MFTVDQTIGRIRAYVRASGTPRSALAQAAGLDGSSLTRLFDDRWNPTADTLRKLERVIPADFCAEQAAA